jgi:5-methylcytosine-specific restriction endonuclease McrA
MNKKLRQKLQNRIYGNAWQRVRPQLLERDGGRCQLRLKGCTVVATEVDHIVPASDDGSLYRQTESCDQEGDPVGTSIQACRR